MYTQSQGDGAMGRQVTDPDGYEDDFLFHFFDPSNPIPVGVMVVGISVERASAMAVR